MLLVHILLAFFIKRESTYILFGAFGALFVLYAFICKPIIIEEQFTKLIFGAIVLRLVWLFSFPNLSEDYARFVWDGRLLVAGYNPFKYLPLDIIAHPLPNFIADKELYNSLNSQTYYTCYPPLLQFVFAISTFISASNLSGNILVLKLFNLLADVGSIFLLIKFCRYWNVDRKNVLLYALNPIVIAELIGNLHFEGIMIFFLLATVYCWQKNKFTLSILLFTAAVITKLVPLMFLPLVFFYWKGKKGFLFCECVIVLTIVSFIPFIDATVAHKFWSSINSYFQESEFNASIYYLVRNITYHFTHENKIQIIGPSLTVISGISIIAYAFWKRNKIGIKSIFKYFSWTMLIYYGFTTTVFPWYITPIIAFAVITNYRFPLVWSATVLISYYADRNSNFEESNLLIFIEYLAVLIAVVWDISKERNKFNLAKVY